MSSILFFWKARRRSLIWASVKPFRKHSSKAIVALARGFLADFGGHTPKKQKLIWNPPKKLEDNVYRSAFEGVMWLQVSFFYSPNICRKGVRLSTCTYISIIQSMWVLNVLILLAIIIMVVMIIYIYNYKYLSILYIPQRCIYIYMHVSACAHSLQIAALYSYRPQLSTCQPKTGHVKGWISLVKFQRTNTYHDSITPPFQTNKKILDKKMLGLENDPASFERWDLLRCVMWIFWGVTCISPWNPHGKSSL